MARKNHRSSRRGSNQGSGLQRTSVPDRRVGKKLLKSSASLVGEEADTLRGQIAQKLQQARGSVSSMRDRTRPAVEASEIYIGGHPWQTVAISAGFGLVVGLLLGRR